MARRAIIFDLDGVLVDACELHYAALNLTLQARGHDPIPMDKHLDVYNGLPTKTKLKLMGIPEDEAKIIEDLKQKATISLIETTIKYDDKKVRLVKELRRLGFFLACVTNCSPKTAGLMLVKSGVLRYMSVVITNADVKDPKPSPESYNLAMVRLQVQPKNCFIVEDSPKGIMAGKASGAKVISVSGPEEVTMKLLGRYIL